MSIAAVTSSVRLASSFLKKSKTGAGGKNVCAFICFMAFSAEVFRKILSGRVISKQPLLVDYFFERKLQDM